MQPWPPYSPRPIRNAPYSSKALRRPISKLADESAQKGKQNGSFHTIPLAWPWCCSSSMRLHCSYKTDCKRVYPIVSVLAFQLGPVDHRLSIAVGRPVAQKKKTKAKKIIIFMLAVKDFYTFSNNNKYRLASNSTLRHSTHIHTYVHAHTHTLTLTAASVSVSVNKRSTNVVHLLRTQGDDSNGSNGF